VAAALLALDLFIGLATLGRAVSTTGEDIRCLQGMNRLRHAYHEMVPGLESYFVTSQHDDIASVLGLYHGAAPGSLRGLAHGLTTTSGMLAVICAGVAAALAAVLVLLAGRPPMVAGVAALLVLGLGLAILLRWMTRQVAAIGRDLEVRFPRPR
jgi:Flp pilus assembly protein TadB